MPKDTYIRIRLTAEEKEKIKAESNRRKTNMSDFVLTATRNTIEKKERNNMSDLISRSKVISVLEQLEEHSLSGKMDISNAIYLLEKQPTAYDVGKVVEKLEEDKSGVKAEKDKHVGLCADSNTKHYRKGEK